jgi:hypothetical protein
VVGIAGGLRLVLRENPPDAIGEEPHQLGAGPGGHGPLAPRFDAVEVCMHAGFGQVVPGIGSVLEDEFPHDRHILRLGIAVLNVPGCVHE